VINVFQLEYETRLKSWYELRQSLEDKDIATRCLEIDKWWQYAPLVNRHLHPQDTLNWPGPWELLHDNIYCHIARGLGMVYTLSLLGVKNIDFCLAKDDNSEEFALVMVDNAKYIMNYYPDSVLNINSTEFKIDYKLDIAKITSIIGKV
jgi:hypothetical protein